MDFGVISSTLTEIAKNVNKVIRSTNYVTTNSLADVSKLTRVEPLTILSKDLINLEYMPDVQNTLLNMFCAYYLQAVDIMTKVHSVEVIRLLDRLNPDRDASGFLLAEGLTLEAYKHSLPMTSVTNLSLEDDGKPPKVNLNDVNNLSVGKLIDIRIGYHEGYDVQPGVAGKGKNGEVPPGHKDHNPNLGNDAKGNPLKQQEYKHGTANLQVAVRLMASVIPDDTITHILSHKAEDNSLIERYHAWRSGRISFIKDLIFAQDLIDEWKRAAIGDHSGTMLEIVRRVNNAKKFGLLTQNPSLASASNIFVISEETARAVESKLGGRLSNANVRAKAFENTYAMIIVVVDREYERVTFYTRGTASSTDVSIKEIKAANKGSKGPDIGDMLKSMMLGSASQF